MTSAPYMSYLPFDFDEVGVNIYVIIHGVLIKIRILKTVRVGLGEDGFKSNTIHFARCYM